MKLVNKTPISIIVAMSKKRRAIGKQGKLLWHIPDDLKRFKQLTLEHPVIMGRKTFESIIEYLGTPLPQRFNIVITRNQNYRHKGVLIVHSLKAAFEKAHELHPEEIYIGGGSDVYTQALPYVDRLYLTLVNDEPDADSFFPDYSTFKKIIEKEERNHKGLSYKWMTLER